MQKVIGVRFKKAGKIFYFNPGFANIDKGDSVIVETPRGLECGQVVISAREIANDNMKVDLIYRKATANDLERLAENREKEKEAFGICLQKIAEHDLPMNLISVEYTFDVNKIIFSFTADGRVDFRELVKDLASVFRTRIELRQVGVRDEAKLLGGVGCCGRPLCCASFLGDFVPVSIRMAKEQNLSLNPAKISGICGRLMCCLKYESDYYCENCQNEPVAIKEPKLADRVVVNEGIGKIVSLNKQRRTATIILDNSKTVIESWDNIFEAEPEDKEVKTIVASVVEENSVEETTSFEPSESQEDKFPRYSKRTPTRSNYQPKTNFYPQNKSNLPPQNRSFQNRDNRDFRETRDNRENYGSNRNNYDRDNRKFQKRDRRNEDYQHNRRPRPRRNFTDDND